MWNSTWKLTLIYLIASAIWFIACEQLISLLPLFAKNNAVYFEIGKVAFYIVVSSFLFYFIIRFHKKKLFRSEEQYKQFFLSNPNPMWIYNRETLEFIEVNNAIIQNYGYSPEEFREMTILDIHRAEDRQKVTEAVKNRSRDYFVSGNWFHQKKNGEIITAFITSHGIEFYDGNYVMVMAQDITLNVEHEAALKKAYETEKGLKEELEKNIALIKQSGEEKQQLTEVIDRINNMVVITDPQGNITWVNSAFTNFTGYAMHEVVGKSVQILHGPNTDPEIYNQIEESLQKHEFLSFEVLNYKKNGQEYWIEFNLSAIYNEKNEVGHYIAIQNVITERKEKEEKIKAYNTALRKLAWTNSHAVRKPVASILGLVELCKHTNQIDEIKELQSLINVCSIELDEVIREMEREISKYETESLKNS